MMVGYCAACAAHYGDGGTCDKGRPIGSPHRAARGRMSIDETSPDEGPDGTDDAFETHGIDSPFRAMSLLETCEPAPHWDMEPDLIHDLIRDSMSR